MERIRSRLDPNELIPVGKGSRPNKGIIRQNLGQTDYITSSQAAKNQRTFSQPSSDHVNADGDSDDDMDILSNDYSSPLNGKVSSVKTKGKLINLVVKKASSPDKKAFRTRPKPRMKSVKKPNIKVAKTVNEELQMEMPPSNQAALTSHNRASNESSPLEELSYNTRFKTELTELKTIRGESSITTSECPSKPKKASKVATGRGIAEFPVSPLSTRKPAEFPVAVSSPARLRSSSNARSKTKSKAERPLVPRKFPLHDEIAKLRRDPDDSDEASDELALTDNDAVLLRGPRPFPMNMSQFDVRPVSKVSRSKRPASGNDEERASRKPRSSSDLEDGHASRSFSMDEPANVDPTTLCPYCDEPWPSSPSSRLLSLLNVAKRKSYKEPRPGNRLGLTAPFSTYVEVCQRHRFEMTHLPLALQRGWPTHLDFPSLPKRIKSFKKELTQLIVKPESSKFWRDLRDDVKQVGRTKMVSVSGQYATFERTQPGYYGEQGSVIIHQTLYSLFPPDLIPEESVDPLTSDQFITYVLVPETATLLIKSDMNLPSNEDAWEVMEESKKYGMAMFPEQGQDETVAEVGERLARERAMLQRKILEERGEADDDVRKQIEEEKKTARKAGRKGKATVFDTEMDAGCSYSRSKRKARAPIKTVRSVERTSNNNNKRLQGGQSQAPLAAHKTPRPKPRILQAATTPPATWKQTGLSSVSSDGPELSQPSSLPGSGLSYPWSYTFDDDACSSPTSTLALESDVDFDEILAHHQDKPELSSDSDVLILTDDPTPKPRVRKLPSDRHISRKIVTGDSESDAASAAIIVAARQAKPETRPKGKQEKNKMGDDSINSTFGQTKRKSKVKRRNASQQSQNDQ